MVDEARLSTLVSQMKTGRLARQCLGTMRRYVVRMNRFKKRFGVDSLILGAAGITLATSLFFLFQDGYLFSDPATQNLTPVGTFKTSSNDVRRRVDSGLTWTNVDAPDKVYEGDSIFTGDGSEASIVLDNGNVIKVDPKSLVVVRTRGSKLELDLQYGSLQGKIAGDQPIVISQNGQTQELGGANGSEVRIVKSEAAKPLRVQVTRGELNVKSATAPAKVVKQNEVLSIREDNTEAVIEKSTITLLEPSSGKTVWLPLGAPLNFRWSAEGKAATAALRIELSKNPNFTNPFFQGEVRGTTFALKGDNRPTGSFYWRIKPQGDSASLPGFATAYADIPPMPVLPVDQQAYFLDVEKGEKSKSVYFTWEDQAGSEDYQVQIARDAQFSSVVATKTGKEKIARVQDLPPGDYFWRVKGNNSARTNPPYSRLMAFSIKEAFKSPKAPLMASTEINYVIPQTVLSRLPASIASSNRGVKPENMTPFTWAPAENAASYEVEVALDSSFTNAVKHDLGSATTFTPAEVRPGQLYLRVRAKSADGRQSPLSEPTRLNVSLPAPTLERVKPVVRVFKSQKEADAATTDFRFAWSPQGFADSYELQWGSDSTFARSKRFKVKENERTMKVSRAANYAVRVRSLDADGQPISPFSQVEIATLKKDVVVPKPVVTQPLVQERTPAAAPDPKLAGLISTLPLPKLREPRPETALISLEAAPTFVTFKWNTYKNASFYTIQIAEDADFTKVVTEKKISKNTFVYEKELPEGKIFWRVRAHIKKGFSEWSDPSDLNVIYQ